MLYAPTPPSFPTAPPAAVHGFLNTRRLCLLLILSLPPLSCCFHHYFLFLGCAPISDACAGIYSSKDFDNLM